MKLKTEITDADVRELGLKSGLEIHQQLEGQKLFCTSPTQVRDDTPDFTVMRSLRASAGESGQVDVAAAAEIKKNKYYVYQGYLDTTCLVELDEEPPSPLSEAALTAGLQTAKLLHMVPVDQLRFMRKIVVNGSNTSGFQRTGLLAQDGYVHTSEGKVGIESLSLEEDSCKEVEKTPEYTVYNLSRLGIPLLEVATAPDLVTPEHIAETAEQLGMILRSLPNVKRGLGTIRQDVNISIRDGVRVEIKGAQDLKLIATLARNEMLRQYNLLQLFTELKQRNASVGTPQQICALDDSDSKVITSALNNPDGVVLAVKLPGFAGLIGQEIQPGRRLGSEYSDYAKVMGVKGLFHSDELPKYGITQEETDAIYAELNASKETDGFLLIAAPRLTAQRALAAACDRAADFTLPKEVRVARPDGTTNYMRPMPGASRMYPETDVAPVTVFGRDVEVPKLLTEQITDLASHYGLAEDIAKRIIRDGIQLDELTTRFSTLKVSFIIDSLYSFPAALHKKHGVAVEQETILLLLEKLDAKEITKDAFEDVALALARGENVDFQAFAPVSLESITDDVTAIVEGMKDKPRGAIIGTVMAKYKGKVDGKQLSQLVNSLL